ncbi:hypothetical protein B5X24_HaOG200710 [Helicoverpa armigera]|uniref:Gustatory receptor n=1 Tax=Helicoverpa armigera TaxID=29058 RepID=A0A2W1BRW7_HELAM|nr:hypothetical protein B5X24_HaOG200710 [Helicoverpa armigera]
MAVTIEEIQNIIDKDLQSLLRPLNLMYILFGCAKYKIHDNKISPNSVIYNTISSITAIFIFCISFYFMIGTFSLNFNGYIYINHLGKIYTYILLIVGCLSDLYTNIFQKSNYISFVMNIQNIYRSLNISGIFRSYIFPNWVSVIALNCFHFTWMFYTFYAFQSLDHSFVFASYYCIVFDMNIVYAIRIMRLINKSLKYWLEDVEMSGRFVTESYWNKMFETYIEILKTYQIIESTFQRTVCLSV